MASVPQIALIGHQDDNYPNSSSFPPLDLAISHRDIPVSLPIQIPRNSQGAPGSSDSHSSYTYSSCLPLSPTAHSSGSIRLATFTVLLDNNPGDHGVPYSSRLLDPPTQGHCRSGRTVTRSSIGTDREVNGASGPRGLALVRMPPSESSISTHVDAGPNTSRPSSVAGFFKRIVRVQKGDHASVKPDNAEADSNVEPFVIKPPQLVALIEPKSLENLESLGGVEGLLHGLGTDRLRGLTTKPTPSSRPDPGIINPATPFGVDLTPTTTLPTALSGALRSAASVGSTSGVDRSASVQISVPQEATLEDRQRIYGKNIFPRRPSKRLLLLMWLALHDKVIVLLSIAAVASLALGVFITFSLIRHEGVPPVDWAGGAAIIMATLVIIIVRSMNNWQKEIQFRALNEKEEDRLVKVIRDGRERQIHAQEVVVGDVVLLEPGDVIPCDGVFLSGHNVWCDESSAPGKSNSIKKLSYEECITTLRDKRLTELVSDGPSRDGDVSQRNTHPSGLELLRRTDCFIISGSKVIEGVGTYVVIAVGTRSLAFPRDSESTPLQIQLNDLTDAITKIGSIAGGLLFVALLIRYFFELETNSFQRTPGEMGVAFINILNMAVTLVVVTLPKGPPLAVALALALATKQMTRENLLVRVLGPYETLANTTVICTGKTGTLTQNEMTVVAGTVGVHAKFIRRFEERREWSSNEERSSSNARGFNIDLANLNEVLPHPVKDLLNEAITTNLTAFEDVDPETGAPVFIERKTESALLGLAKELGWPNCKDTRNSADIIRMTPFNSNRKSMSCVVRLPDGSHRLYVKSASEILARNCTRHVVVGDAAPSANEVETAPIGELEEDIVSRTIGFYASQTLRTIALCYRDFPYWPPKGAYLRDNGEVDYDILMTNLTLISIIAIEDPLRPGVREAVDNCGKAGVRVKMCTGDNVLTARSIAQQCGIYTPGGIVMEGPHFRTLSPGDVKTIVPRLQVLARSSPEDKRILVETLKELGDVVGVTSRGTNDGPALKTAHVGFSMGLAGTEVAKEASDIILMDDNFSSIVGAIMWGRCVNDSVRKYLQFLISGNVTAIVTTFVWALASSSEESVLNAVQLLWINLIVDTFAVLALATDPASPAQLDRKPDKKAGPLFAVDMTKQILGQAIYQIAMILIFHFLGSQILGLHHTNDATLLEHHDVIVRTLVFNAFVFAQIFNSFNCRRLDRNVNVFEGMTKNWYFMAVTTIEVAVQVLICFFGGSVFDVVPMGAREWAISLALGCIPLPLGALIRLMPNEPCEHAFEKLQLLPTHGLLPIIRPDVEPGSSFGMDHVHDNSGSSADLRRGSVHGPSQVRKRHCAFPDPDATRHASAMVPSPDASLTTVPDWQWRVRGSRSDPGFHPTTSSATLWESVFEVHPDTPRDDPVYGLLGKTP